MINLPLSRIKDTDTRTGLQLLQEAHNGNDLNLGSFKHFTITATKALTNAEFYHHLGFVPKDIIVTSMNGGTVSWAYDRFDKDKIVYSTTSAMEVRFLLGSI